MQPWFVELLLPGQKVPVSSPLDFAQGEELWSDRDIKMLDDEKWLARNFQSEWEHTLRYPARKHICEAALSAPGPMLEIAAGPGGGNLSPLLHLDPTARIIVNDLEPRIVERWHTSLATTYPQLAFAAFDAASIPFKDGSLGSISSRGGLSNCRGDADMLLGECSRVLKPGGLLVLYEMCFSPRTRDSLPQALRDAWVISPWLYGEWGGLLRSHGFRVAFEELAERVVLDPQNSALAYDAALFGVEIEVEFRALLAVIG